MSLWARLLIAIGLKSDLEDTVKHYERLEMNRGIDQSAVNWDAMKRREP